MSTARTDRFKATGSWAYTALPPADVACPRSVAELAELVASGRRPFAGGTDLLIRSAQARAVPPLVWTAGVPELRQIESRDSIRLGGAVTMTQASTSRDIRLRAPALADAAVLVGSIQIRNRATVAGNLCNASPAADTVPALAVHATVVRVQGGDAGSREVPVDRFCTGPGTTVLAPGEYVVGLDLDSLTAGEGSAYRRFTVRKSMDLAFVGVAVRLRVADDGEVQAARIALGAVGPTVQVPSEAAQLLVGGVPDLDRLRACGEAAAAACRPIDDLRASAEYRRRLVTALVIDAASAAYARARGGNPGVRNS
jgi:CO/xanthine dehydrogenase FAD-binding subunit